MPYAGPVLPGQNEAYFRYSGQSIPLPKATTPTPSYPPASTFGQVTQQTSQSSPQVLGTQSSAPTYDPIAEARAAEERAAQERYNAENQSLNTQFDYSKAQLEGQLGTLGTQKEQSMSQVDLGLADVNRQVGTSKTNLGTNTQQQINEAGSTARNVQGQNRNVLRALGILNSSAAGQIMAKPMNQFDEQRARLGQYMVQKSAELDDFVNQKVAEAAQVKNNILQSYNDLVGKIQTDLRFNDRQRNDAIQQANAALSQRMSEISQTVMQYQQQAQQQAQQLQASVQQALSYQAPQADKGAILGTAINTPTQTSSSANIYQDPLKKKTAQDQISQYFAPNTLGGFQL